MKKWSFMLFSCAVLFITLLPATAFGGIGETFTVQSTDSTTAVVTVKILAEPSGATPGIVQVGDGTFSAIANDVTAVTLPGVVEHPDTHKQYQVTTVGDSAFRGCNQLKTLNLPKVTDVGDSAFRGCTQLKTLNLPKVTDVGDSAFYGCASIVTIELPEVTDIGDSAFYRCEKLNTISLPEALYIEDYAFTFCSALVTTELPKATTIGDSAFSECSSLTTISLPEALSIESYAFYCNPAFTPSKLTTVDLPKVTDVGDHAFSECSSLTTISLPEALSIGSYAFYCVSSLGPSKLTTVDLPKVTDVGDHAFTDCTALTTIELPEVLSIGASAFYCDPDFGPSTLTTVNLPKATTIGNSAFYKCGVLKNLELPKVTDVEAFAFADCASLANISLPEALSIGASAFCCDPTFGPSTLTTVNLPKVTDVGDHAFNKCGALVTLYLPKATTIGNYSFSGCASLDFANLPEVTSIGSYAFYCDPSVASSVLVTANLPKVTFIGNSVFYKCGALVTLSLPKVTDIGNYTFAGCTNLRSITIWQPSATVGPDAFCETSANCTLYVPHSFIDNYTVSGNWPSTVVGLWSVTGAVYDETGTVATDAAVSIYDITIQTDSKGIYEVYVKPNDNTPATITAQIEGKGERSINVSNVKSDLPSNHIYFSTVATPTFSPVGGNYTSAQNVTISCTTKDVTIYYTTDGTEPTKASKVYVANTPIAISASTSLKARAYKDGFAASEIAEATYIFSSVSSVAVNPATVYIQKGGTQQFNASVMGKNSPVQTVIWTVEGGITGTSIDSNGVLTIAANETATVLTVKATSTANTTISGTATVTVTAAPAVKYIISIGQNGKWAKGSIGDLSFTADVDYNNFIGVSVDGVALSSDKYTSQSGSTIVTLKASYLQTLSVGQHTLNINFTDGYAETNFTIGAVSYNPPTGDTSQPWLWLGIGLLACVGLAVSLILKRRNQQNG